MLRRLVLRCFSIQDPDQPWPTQSEMAHTPHTPYSCGSRRADKISKAGSLACFNFPVGGSKDSFANSTWSSQVRNVYVDVDSVPSFILDVNYVNHSDKNIKSLPAKILLRILRIVPLDFSTVSMMLTCKLFLSICQSKQFWQRRHLWLLSVINDAFLARFTNNYGDNVKFFAARGNIHFKDSHFVQVIKQCPSLTHIDVSGTSVSNFSVKELVHIKANQLKSLVLAHCTNVDCATLLLVVEKHAKSLVELDIRECVDMYTKSGMMLSSVARTCRNLGCLRIGQVVNSLHCVGIGHIEVMKFVNAAPKIYRLELPHSAINDNTMKLICEHLADLTALNVAYTNLSDSTVRMICTKLTQLECLDLSYSCAITDTALTRLDNLSSTLTDLNLSGCLDLAKNGLPFPATMSKLRVLRLNDVYRVSDGGIMKVFNHCPSLGYLDIVNTNVSQVVIDRILFTARRFKLFLLHGTHPKIKTSASIRVAC